MAEFTFDTNESTNWYRVRSDKGVKVTASGTFGGGTLAFEQKIANSSEPILDGDDIAIAYTADFDRLLDVRKGDIIRFTLSGATSPSLPLVVSGSLDILE